MTFYVEVGLGPSHIVLDGDPAPLPQKGDIAPPIFGAFFCRQTTVWIKMALGMELGLGPGDFAFDGVPATPRTGGTPTSTQFLAHVYCGQTAGSMKMPLGMEVDLIPGHIVLDGSQLCAKREQQPPASFGLCLLWPRSPISATAELFFPSVCNAFECKNLSARFRHEGDGVQKLF